VQRDRDQLKLVTAPEVSSSVERYLGRDRAAALSKAALEVLSIIAYRQPITRSGVELIRGSASDSALDSLLQRGLVEHNQHHLLVTTRAFLDYLGLRDLADLPPLPSGESAVFPGWLSSRVRALAAPKGPAWGPGNAAAVERIRDDGYQ
jgi:segregation and condensation protein B